MAIVSSPHKPKVVDVDPALLDKVLRDERSKWERKLERMHEGINS